MLPPQKTVIVNSGGMCIHTLEVILNVLRQQGEVHVKVNGDYRDLPTLAEMALEKLGQSLSIR